MARQRNRKNVDQNGVDRDRVHQFSKTKMCRFEMLGKCTKGPQCPFAHGAQELRDLPDLACTKMCKTLLQTGTCDKEDCTYAHSKSELRATSSIARSSAADLDVADAAPVEVAAPAPMKVSVNADFNGPACPPLPYSPLPWPPMPPVVPNADLQGCKSDVATGYTNCTSFNDLDIGSDASNISRNHFSLKDGRKIPAEICAADGTPREPAYVRLAMPAVMFQSQISGGLGSGIWERSDLDERRGLNFLGVGKGDDSMGHNTKFQSQDCADVFGRRLFGWPVDQPSYLHGGRLLRQQHRGLRLAGEEGPVGSK